MEVVAEGGEAAGVEVDEALGLAFVVPEGGVGLFEFVEEGEGLGGGGAGGEVGGKVEEAAGEGELGEIVFVGPGGGGEAAELGGPGGGLLE